MKLIKNINIKLIKNMKLIKNITFAKNEIIL